MDVRAGSRIGRTVVDGFVAHGGMADVWRVRDPDGQLLAAKVLRVPEVRARFVLEARVQLSLDHPHVVRAVELVDEPELLALLMEYVDGRSLEGWVNTTRPSFPDRERVSLQLIEAVGYAHARGLVHRDLKPGNVLVLETDDGPFAKVTDFGLAKDLDGPAATRSGAALGTPRFMAPEQFRDAKRVTHRADLWSIGVVLYELFTGRSPFHRESLRHVFTAVLDGRYQDPAELGAPPNVARAIRACLKVDPDERVADAEHLARILLDDDEETAPLERLPSTPEDTPTWLETTLVDPVFDRKS
ncbi:MAG: serine/threonine protein kinase [Alphaproteobacteria bacterium]|nr:serine/threonine protein kinase [Alphaproteobacteria bacterium]